MSLRQLSDTVNSLDFKGLGHAFLINRQGLILAHPDPQKVTQTIHKVFGENTKILSELQISEQDGHARLIGFSPWGIRSGRSASTSTGIWH